MAESIVPSSWLDEADRVRLWRFDELRRMGYLRPDAEFLAAGDINIRRLEHLIFDEDCPLELAARILT